MKRMSTQRTGLALLLAVVALCLAPAIAGKPQQAPERGIYGGNDGPVWMLISLTPDFVLTDATKINNGNIDEGSQVILVQVGTYVAGFDVGDTIYVGENSVDIPVGSLPIDPNTGLPQDPETLDDNQYALIGSFCTFNGELHYMSTDPGPIPEAVQAAFFYASPTLGDVGQFPTTVAIANHIYENQGDAGASFQEIHQSLTITTSRLTCTQCSGTDDIFPHDPVKRLFRSTFNFSTDLGSLTLVHERVIGFDYKATNTTDPINLGSNGNFNASILTQDRDVDAAAEVNFDATTDVLLNTVALYGELKLSDGSMASVGPLYPTKHSFVDVDGDGDLDLKLWWDTDELQAFVEDVAPGQPEVLMTLRVVGESPDGMPFSGTDDVKVVP